MSNKNRYDDERLKNQQSPEADSGVEVEGEVMDNENASEEATGENESKEELTPEAEIENLKEQLAKEKKEYMFLMAEFDNFRKRTLREKSEIIKNAGEQVLKGLLPIVDDFERGLKASENVDDPNSIREGMLLIYNKLKKYLEQNGVKEFDPEDKEFNADRHEAISVVPVADEEAKGKILDTIEKGYMINDKVLRHAKVVVGQ